MGLGGLGDKKTWGRVLGVCRRIGGADRVHKGEDQEQRDLCERWAGGKGQVVSAGRLREQVVSTGGW